MLHQPESATSILKLFCFSILLASCTNSSQQGDWSRKAQANERISRQNSIPLDASSLDASTTRVLARHFKINGPGAAILISRNGTVQLQKCYGLANVAKKQPITPQSVFDLASLSKQFTATAALLLISEGKLSLQDKVSKVLPDFRVPVKGRAVTVGDLIYHLSGLADYTEDWEGSDRAFKYLTTSTHLKWLNQTKPRRAPGIKWEYNNTGYALLALVIERKSGMPLRQFIQKRLFTPAGMKQSLVHDKLAMHQSIPQLVTGYSRENGTVSHSALWTQITGDGNVLTTIEDMARWDKALRGNTILSETQKKLAWSTGHLDSGKKIDDAGIGYGFGWVTDEENASISHTGAWMGTSTYIVRYLKSGLTIVVLSNDENADVEEIGNEIKLAVET